MRMVIHFVDDAPLKI